MTNENPKTFGDPNAQLERELLSLILFVYIVRTEQLHSRFDGVALKDLLIAVNNVSTMIAWPPEVLSTLCAEERDPTVDEYLDGLQEHISAALRPH